MSLFSLLTSGKISNALRQGAVVIDVRTPHEFDQGKVPDSINIPVDRIAVNAIRIKNMHRPVVLCSSGDHRSDAAARILRESGIKNVYNAGSWEKVLKLLGRL